MTNNGPSLATLVKKWLKTYSTKSNWDFRYEYDDKNRKEILTTGYLMLYKHADDMTKPAIMIEDDRAVIGEFGRTHWGNSSEWRETFHSKIKLIAADPRFFAKLDRAMQFLTRARQRRAENEKKFAQEELNLLEDILG